MRNFQNIVTVKGYKNSIQYDFNRQTFYQLSSKGNDLNLNPIKQINYVKKENNFLTPSIITNAIIDIDRNNELSYIKKIFESFDKLLCKHIVIKCRSVIDLFFLEKLIKLINYFNIHEVTLLFQYSDALYSDTFGSIIMSSNRIKAVIIFESPFDKNFEDLMHFTVKKKEIKYTKDRSEFKNNHILYSESLNYNSYFNRKLYISPSGKIKNAPETEEVFGYIQDIKCDEELKQIISTPAFQKYWYVHKDLIDICKDCEFRHMCVDNKVPFERAKNEWFHKVECNYNPYIAKWKGEEGYKPLKECGVISNKNGFMIDHEKIAEINASLWLEIESYD